MSGQSLSAGLRDRIVLAVLEALQDGDPVLRIAVGDNEVRVSYDPEWTADE